MSHTFCKHGLYTPVNALCGVCLQVHRRLQVCYGNRLEVMLGRCYGDCTVFVQSPNGGTSTDWWHWWH
jgi:hypothetical protein